MPNRLMTWKEQALLAVLAGALGLGALALFVAGGERAPTVPAKAKAVQVAPADDAAPFPRVEPMGAPPPIPEPAPLPDALPRKIVVEVKGAVKRPNVYRLAEGARVDDLLTEAGGPLEEADLTGINRAAVLIDATTLVVPMRWGAAMPHGHHIAENPAPYTLAGQGRAPLPAGAATTPGAHRATAGTGTGGAVNLNTASKAELEALPRVGPVTAQKIIDFRNETPFQQVEDLLSIHGIGEKTLDGLRPYVTVR